MQTGSLYSTFNEILGIFCVKKVITVVMSGFSPFILNVIIYPLPNLKGTYKTSSRTEIPFSSIHRDRSESGKRLGCCEIFNAGKQRSGYYSSFKITFVCVEH